MIEVQELSKHYGPVTAVDRLTFGVRPGVVTGFLGGNGSGKSTTLRLVLGLDTPTAGTARIDGRRFRDLPWPGRQVGAHLDPGSAHPGRTARAHLRALAAASRIPASRVEEVLALVGLADVGHRRVGGFSLGMRQRLGLATALLGDPGVLLLDEPANGLDPEGIHWLRALVRSLASEGRTVFVSSHLIAELARIADDLVVIGQGRLLAAMSVAEFAAGAESLEDAFLALTSAKGAAA